MKTKTLAERAKQIRALILDVDGVLTDGTFYLTPDNQEIKSFHTHDGLGIKNLQALGIIIAIISGRKSIAVEHRMQELNVEHVFLGIHSKITVYDKLLSDLNLTDEHVAYMGDDLPDLPLIKRAGLGIAPANAVTIVKQHADWITQRRAGDAAVREVCDFICNLSDGG